MNKTKINAEVVADSISPQGDRLTSLQITFPRILLSEINTHRMLSKNTSSSRAIPFNKMVEAIENNPFIPIAWQRSHSGMQGTKYITDLAEIQGKNLMWLAGRGRAIQTAKNLHKADVTKQLANRLLEPFMWTTMLITGSKEGWENFFNLRCPQYQIPNWDNSFKSWKKVCKELPYEEDTHYLNKAQFNKGQAEIHMMALAECIYDAVNESTPKQLQSGEWHIPFEMKIVEILAQVGSGNHSVGEQWTQNKVKISTAMAAHTSYTIVGGEAVKSHEKWIDLHDKLIAYDPPHSSPMEHCARAMSDEEHNRFYKGIFIDMSDTELENSYVPISVNGFGWCNNFKGFIPYRYIIDNKIEL